MAATEVKEKKTDPTNQQYQVKECIMWGSLYERHLLDLENRLTGICDPGFIEFHEHEMNFSLRTGGSEADVSLRLRRKFNMDPNNSNQWRFRYIGRPEPDPACPAVVRKVIDSVAHSPNMMDFVKTIGLRMDYEFISKGKVWTCGAIKVSVFSLRRTKSPGLYDPQQMEKVSDSHLVEMSITLPDTVDYHPVARQLKTFADQLYPLVEMQKVEYWLK